MATPAQQIANAANAQHSTGPRTPEGKAASSRNAMKHGLAAGRAVVFPHEREEYEDFRAELTATLAPEGALEETLFEQLADAAWGLRRLRILELDLYQNAGHIDPLCQNEADASLRQIARYRVRAERSLYTAIARLRQLQTDRSLRTLALTQEEAEDLPALADPTILAVHTTAGRRSHARAKAEDDSFSAGLHAGYMQALELPVFSDEDFAQWCAENRPQTLEAVPYLRRFLRE